MTSSGTPSSSAAQEALNQQQAALQQQIQNQQQPITITNAQGQQMTIIPTQQIRPNSNIIQMQGGQMQTTYPVQHIPGIGNVQVIPASALNGNFMQPMQTLAQVPQQQSPAPQQSTQQPQTISLAPQPLTNIKQEGNEQQAQWIFKPEIMQASAAPLTQTVSMSVRLVFSVIK